MGDLLGSPHLVARNKTVRWKPFGGPKRTILCRGRRSVTQKQQSCWLLSISNSSIIVGCFDEGREGKRGKRNGESDRLKEEGNGVPDRFEGRPNVVDESRLGNKERTRGLSG